MSEEQKAVFDCPNCNKKMRVPTNKGRIHFACPDCKASLEWAPAPTAVQVEPVIEDVVLDIPQTSKPLSTENEENSPWADVSAAVFFAVISIGIIGVFDLNLDGFGAFMVYLIGGGLSLFSVYTGIKGLFQKGLQNRRVKKNKTTARSDTVATSQSRWKRQDEEGKSALNYLTAIGFYVAFIAGIVWYFGDTAMVAIINTLAGMAIIYAFYKMIKVFSGTNTSGAVGLTFLALFILGTAPGLIIALLPEGRIGFDIGTFFAGTDPVMADSHFKDVKVEDTSPSDLDELMEGWE